MFDFQMTFLRTLRRGPLAVLVAAASLGVLVPAAVGAESDKPLESQRWLQLYSNRFNERTDLRELRKLGDGRCERATRSQAMEVMVGSSTRSCTYRTPVNGESVETGASVTLKSGISSRVAKRTSLGVTVNADEGEGYRFGVVPRLRRYVLTRVVTAAGKTTITELAEGREETIKGTGSRNRVRLRVKDGALVAWANDKVVAKVTDPQASTVDGIATGVGMFSTGASINGAAGRLDSVTVRVPDPR